MFHSTLSTDFKGDLKPGRANATTPTPRFISRRLHKYSTPRHNLCIIRRCTEAKLRPRKAHPDITILVMSLDSNACRTWGYSYLMHLFKTPH